MAVGRRTRGPVDGLRASGWAMFAINLCGYDCGRQAVVDGECGVPGNSLNEYLWRRADAEQREFVSSVGQLMEW